MLTIEEIMSLLSRTGYDFSDCIISATETIANQPCHMDTLILSTSTDGAVEASFTPEELIPGVVLSLNGVLKNTPNPFQSQQVFRGQVASLGEALYDQVVVKSESVGVEPSEFQVPEGNSLEERKAKAEEFGRSLRKRKRCRRGDDDDDDDDDDDYVYDEEDYSEDSEEYKSDTESYEARSKCRKVTRESKVRDHSTRQAAKVEGSAEVQSSNLDPRVKIQNPVEPGFGRLIYSYPHPCHNFEKGKFVVARADLYKNPPTSISQISDNYILQRFELGMINTYHATQRFLGYTLKDRSCKFIPIEVETLPDKSVTIFGGQLPELVDDEVIGLKIFEYFETFVQILASESLSNGFMGMVEKEKVDHFLCPMIEFDKALQTVGDSILENTSWDENFKNALDLLPWYSVYEHIPTPNSSYVCQATNNPALVASRVIVLFGRVYDRETLMPCEVTAVPAERENQIAYLINDSQLDKVLDYHKAKHFKYHLLEDSMKEVGYRKANKPYTNDLIQDIMSSRERTKYFFTQFDRLLKANEMVMSVDS